jgi:two-component sensor histidine kinase
MYDKEEDRSIVCVARDITEPKIIHENKEIPGRVVLLREIHHRVKNNMQIISSLLMLQSQYVKNKEDAIYSLTARIG